MADSDVFDDFENDSQFNTIKEDKTKKNLMNDFDQAEDSILQEEQNLSESKIKESHFELENEHTIISNSKQEFTEDFSEDFDESVEPIKAKKSSAKQIQSQMKSEKKSKFNNMKKFNSEKKVKTFKELYEENQKLFNEMQDINKKLTDMIDKKGYEKLLNKIKNNKRDFKNRPDDVKILTYNQEIENNEKIIRNLQQDFNNYEAYQKRMDSTVLLNSMKGKIHKVENQIKNLKNEVNNGEIENKKQALKLVKQVELKQKKFSFKKIINEVDSYMQKIEEHTQEIIKLRTLQNDLTYEIQKGEKQEKKLKDQQENMGIQEDNRTNQEKYKTMKKVVNKWKNWIQVTEHNFEQKIEFIERDIGSLQSRIKELYGKSESLNKVLENQHKIFSEFISVENSHDKPISLKNMGMDKKKKSVKKKVAKIEISNSISSKKQSKVIIKHKKDNSFMKRENLDFNKKIVESEVVQQKYEFPKEKKSQIEIQQVEESRMNTEVQNLDESLDSILKEKNQNVKEIKKEEKVEKINVEKKRKMSDEDLDFMLTKKEQKVEEKDEFKDSDFDFLNQII